MRDPSILVKGLSSGYEIEHLVRVFYPAAALRSKADTGTKGTIVYARVGKTRLAAGYRSESEGTVRIQVRPKCDKEAKRKLSRMVYDLLCEVGDIKPPWGMLTGVRPVRLLRRELTRGGDEAARDALMGFYDVSEPKYRLAHQVAEAQREALAQNEKKDYSLYISIPFCPSRCSYCSFVSQSIERESGLIEPYLEKLGGELALTGEMAKELGLRLRSVYIGGGTPTSLSAGQLAGLLNTVAAHFPLSAAAEFTVEAGRPDCTDFEKLRVLKEGGVTRISINPQSMDENVLRAMGRNHTPGDILRCFEDARRAGHGNVNMDVIAGLPEDAPATFAATLGQLAALRPENLTVHTLTLKRGSGLSQRLGGGHPAAAQMLEKAYPALEAAGYHPYYLYRQKGTPGNLENTGWTQKGYEGLYNIYIMEEVQTILSVGAGGVTKLVAGQGSFIQRSYNDKYPLEYLRNFEKVSERKRGVRETYAGILDSKTAR